MNKHKTLHSFTLHNYREIPQIAGLSQESIEAIEVVGRVLPFKTNNYVVDELINWDNVPDDPIFTLNFPRKAMLEKTYYNRVLKLMEAGEPSGKLKEEINAIRLRLNPNPYFFSPARDRHVMLFVLFVFDGLSSRA